MTLTIDPTRTAISDEPPLTAADIALPAQHPPAETPVYDYDPYERGTFPTMALNLWHNLPTGPEVPERVYCIVEIPKGSRNKYEYSKKAGIIKLDRVLYSPMHYPSDYGLIPQTFAEDGDPLDIMVMVNEPTFAGCVIEARPIAIFHMLDRGDPDDKILAVPATDPIFDDYKDIGDIPKHFLNEVAHFFQTYKQLQGIQVTPKGWENAEAAKAVLLRSIELYKETFPPQMV